jgi:thioredoxin-like negative regulator of GroEL
LILVIKIHQEMYRVEVLLGSGKVLFALMAGWCTACRRMRPELDALEARFKKVKFVEADADNSPSLINKLDVHLLPLILVMHAGKQVHASEGLIDPQILEEKLRDEKQTV